MRVVLDGGCGSRDLPIPSPNAAVVTNTDQNASVFTETGLPDGRGALGMGQHGIPEVGGVLDVQIPEVSLANLVAERQQLLLLVHTESNEPNFAIFKIQLVQDGHL